MSPDRDLTETVLNFVFDYIYPSPCIYNMDNVKAQCITDILLPIYNLRICNRYVIVDVSEATYPVCLG